MNKLIVTVLLATFSLFLSDSLSADPSPKSDGNLVIHFIDVGQGDASFVQLPDGNNLLIDTGSPAAGPKLSEYLKSLHITKINHLILTHPHDDHIGGIFNVLSEFSVDALYDNGFSNFNSALYFDYVTAVRKDLSRYNIMQAGESLHIGEVKLEVLNPLLPPIGNINHDSIVLRLKFKNMNIFFSGDLGTPGEQRLLKTSPDLKSQILKVAHHGENDALSGEFLDMVKPETGIISVSLLNKYARPHAAVLTRLSERNIKVYRTDLAGTVIITTDGNTYSVSTEK